MIIATITKTTGCKTVTILTLLILTWITGQLLPSISQAEQEETLLWEKLQSGNHFALIRHALAPGGGDPDTFTLGKCETQRNLSEKGRDQARLIGELFHRNNITQTKIYSSQWCRCLDTARLMNLGKTQELPLLNSFFLRFEKEAAQTEELIRWLNRQDFSTPHILVTHQVNITALTDIFPSSGEIIIVHHQKDGSFTIEGTIPTD